MGQNTVGQKKTEAQNTVEQQKTVEQHTKGQKTVEQEEKTLTDFPAVLAIPVKSSNRALTIMKPIHNVESHFFHGASRIVEAIANAKRAEPSFHTLESHISFRN